VQQAVVSTVKDASGRDQHLVAYVVPTAAETNGNGSKHGAARLTSAELNHFASQKLPAFMTPSAFVFLPAFPLTPSGKVDRRALPTPDLDSLERAGRRDLVAPRTPTEEMIAAIWRKLLQLEQVGIDENFFDLGGHSIMATQVASRMQKAFGVEIPVLALFEQHTIAGLANLVDAKILEQTSDNLLARLLAEVDVLSSNEVKQQLARQ
jgi:acyl carrier protein